MKLTYDLVALPDGTYNARWSGYSLKIIGEDDVLEVITIEGIRGINVHIRVRVKDGEVTRADENGIKPFECKSMEEVGKMDASGMKISDYGIEVSPNVVILTTPTASMKVPMSIFKKFSEWYLNGD